MRKANRRYAGPLPLLPRSYPVCRRVFRFPQNSIRGRFEYSSRPFVGASRRSHLLLHWPAQLPDSAIHGPGLRHAVLGAASVPRRRSDGSLRRLSTPARVVEPKFPLNHLDTSRSRCGFGRFCHFPSFRAKRGISRGWFSLVSGLCALCVSSSACPRSWPSPKPSA